MSYPISVKENAIKLRTNGYSIKEISKYLKIAKSTSSEWLKNVELDEKARKRLEDRHLLGQYKTAQTFKIKREKLIESIENQVIPEIQKYTKDKTLKKIYCALLYWTEGGKNKSCVNFTNSDIKMTALFIKLLRECFNFDERKLKVRLHLHEYHNEEAMKILWGNALDINYNQFNKIYLKPHTKKRKKDYYPGCANVRYFDYKIALELYSIYNMLTKQVLGV
ncbi:hypothetical protein KW795_01535 [Candidatus Microgenomates bacterium]|nr:hypothetical protein [Candidatus Microgenomates bacterium]